VTEVFISYSRKDSLWLERIRDFLVPLLQKQGISIWSDSQIKPGESWMAAMQESIRNAQAVILLISPSYFESKWSDIELASILDRAKQKKLQAFPVIISPVSEEVLADGILNYQMVNSLYRPLNSLSEQEQFETLTNLYNAVIKSVSKSSKNEPQENINANNKYVGAMNQAVQNVVGQVVIGGSNLFGDSNNIFFEAERRLKEKDDK
jgi:TIR domain